MRDDDLLRKLGQMARERPAGGRLLLDERWNRLAAGTLSAEEDAELRRLAAGSDDARDAYEAFRPLGAEFHARIVRAVTPPRVLPFVRRVAAWGAATGTMAATIVALLLPPVPTYAVAEILGGSRTTRGDLAEAPVLAPGDRFQASLRPETTVRLASLLRARAFLLRGSDLRALDVRTQRDESGAVRLTGTLDRDLPPGPWTLWLVVARVGSLPDPSRLRSLAPTAPVRGRNWVAVPAPLTIGSSAKE